MEHRASTRSPKKPTSTTLLNLASRGRLFAALIPLGALVCTAALLVVVSKVHDEGTARREMLVNVDLIANESAAVTDSYLGAAESSSSLLENISRTGEALDISSGVTEEAEPLLNVLYAMVSAHPQLDGAFVGFPSGDFAYVHRDGDGFGTKLIVTDPDGSRRVDLRTTTAEFTVTSTTTDPDDTYDPRTRPWFAEATTTEGPIWTDPYLFFESGEPGVTHARPLADSEGSIIAVVGLDVRLAELAEFLGERRPSTGSTVMVLNELGEVVAGASSQPARIDGGSGDANDPGEPIADPIRLAIDPSLVGTTSFVATGDSAAAQSIKPLATTAPWLLVVSAPEEDFLSELRADAARLAIASFLAIIAATVFLLALTSRLMARFRELHRAATCDSLTGLSNREVVRQDLQERLERPGDHVVAVLIIDIDKFKLINDTYGHLAGDQVLTETASRLMAEPESTSDLIGHRVGRLGGDELIVVFDVASVATAEKSARALHGQLTQPITLSQQLNDRVIDVGFSIGLAWQQVGEARPVGELLREADLALYQAKSAGGGVATYADPDSTDPDAKNAVDAKAVDSETDPRQFSKD